MQDINRLHEILRKKNAMEKEKNPLFAKPKNVRKKKRKQVKHIQEEDEAKQDEAIPEEHALLSMQVDLDEEAKRPAKKTKFDSSSRPTSQRRSDMDKNIRGLTEPEPADRFEEYGGYKGFDDFNDQDFEEEEEDPQIG